MKLHLIRHAEAIDRFSGFPDEFRYLTTRGRTRFRRVAETFDKCGGKPEIIVSSPLVRAVQTAEIMAETIRFRGDLIIHPSVAAGFTRSHFTELLKELSQAGEAVIVGHEPDLGLIVGELLDLSPCAIRKGGIVTLNLKLQEAEPTAGFLRLITGGGKLISDCEAARQRLSGG